MTNTLMGESRYLFDTDVLIVAKNNYYNPEIVPAFWQWILEGHQQGYFYSIDKVSDELKRGNEEDFLHQFATKYSAIFLHSNNMGCIAEYAKLQTWATLFGRKVKIQIKSVELPKLLHLKLKLTLFWLLMQKLMTLLLLLMKLQICNVKQT